MGARGRASLGLVVAVGLHALLGWLLSSLRDVPRPAGVRVDVELVARERPPVVATSIPAPTASERQAPPRARPRTVTKRTTPSPARAESAVTRAPQPEAPVLDVPRAPAPPSRTRAGFLDRVLRGTHPGPWPVGGSLLGEGEPDRVADEGGSETERNLERIVTLAPDEYRERAVEIVIVDGNRRRSLREALEALELDGRARAFADRSAGTLVLEKEEDGSLRYDGVGVVAWIRSDGSVTFRDRAALDVAGGPLAGDGRGGKTGHTVEEVLPAGIEQHILPWLSGVFDLEDALHGLAGDDVNRREKAWFLAETSTLREQMRRDHAASPG